jgi:hypothetical protein
MEIPVQAWREDEGMNKNADQKNDRESFMFRFLLFWTLIREHRERMNQAVAA